MGIAIIIMTLLVRTLLVPVFRKQIVGQRRMQLVQPEIKALQARYKGDRPRSSRPRWSCTRSAASTRSPGACPTLITFVLLIPMYSVISAGLTNYDPNAMLNVFGVQLITLDCPPAPVYVNGQRPAVPRHGRSGGWAGSTSPTRRRSSRSSASGSASSPSISALLQVVQTRMVMPPATPGDRRPASSSRCCSSSRSSPSLYGGILPAGLFIYWIVTTIFSIVQQYLIVGWGSLFPLFGCTPGFARDHKPRFPVTFDAPPAKESARGPAGAPAATMSSRTDEQRAASAASTVRQRGRQGRRGRRR